MPHSDYDRLDLQLEENLETQWAWWRSLEVQQITRDN